MLSLLLALPLGLLGIFVGVILLSSEDKHWRGRRLICCSLGTLIGTAIGSLISVFLVRVGCGTPNTNYSCLHAGIAWDLLLGFAGWISGLSVGASFADRRERTSAPS